MLKLSPLGCNKSKNRHKVFWTKLTSKSHLFCIVTWLKNRCFCQSIEPIKDQPAEFW